MKYLIALVILSGFGLLGSAFFGVYTAPGLEQIPTFSSIRGKNENEKEEEKDSSGLKRSGPSGIFPVRSDGTVDESTNLLMIKKESGKSG